MAEYKFEISHLRDGEMMRVEIEGKPVVLACAEGQYYAFGGQCPHYSAPLEKGVLKGHSLMCPWHHACFDIRSGQRLEPPALNDLRHYAVSAQDGQATVTFPHDNTLDPQGITNPDEKQSFVIIGGGAAGETAAEELRRGGFPGKIVIISSVPETPVDRPNLSKDYLDGHAKPEWMPLRSENWYAAHGIELRLNTHVIGIDTQAHTVKLNDGSTLQYHKLLLASGAIPRRLSVPGADLEGIYTLRSVDDANAIIEAAGEGKQAVIVGASFIGMEVAAALGSGRGVAVTVVGLETVPFAQIVGEKVGRVFQKVHEENGVKFRLSSEIGRFMGENGHVVGVELKSGETLPADFVVVGVGVIPATDFLKDSGLKLNDRDQSVLVDAYLQTSDSDIYAAGDIARWDDGSEKGMRIEHWRLAQQHGMVAARNMLDQRENFNQHVPFFWTNQWKFGIRYIGHASAWDEIIYRGEPETQKFIAFYLAGGKLLAAAGHGRDRDMAAIEFILRDEIALTPDQMRDENFDLAKHATSVKG
jgi:apoptosis-inducing factor 3